MYFDWATSKPSINSSPWMRDAPHFGFSWLIRRIRSRSRTHLALGKDAPLGRAVQRSGTIVAIPILSGLHHHDVRI
jgi:hypothetical protein